jgi:hypothetical protein
MVAVCTDKSPRVIINCVIRSLLARSLEITSNKCPQDGIAAEGI